MASIILLAEDIADELSIGRPSVLIGDDGDGAKILRFMRRTCRLLAKRDWEFLKKEQTFTTVAAESQTSAIPTDFKRFVNGTFWNRTTRRPVVGPLSSSEWAYYKANVNAGVRDQFRQAGGEIQIYPAPPAGQTIAYEYIKNTICTASDGVTEKSDFETDADIPIFDDELVILGVVWRYKKSAGGDYAEEFREFVLRLEDEFKNDGGSDIINMGGSRNLGRVIKPMYEDYAD